jgi:hypothetical protein
MNGSNESSRRDLHRAARLELNSSLLKARLKVAEDAIVRTRVRCARSLRAA